MRAWLHGCIVTLLQGYPVTRRRTRRRSINIPQIAPFGAHEGDVYILSSGFGRESAFVLGDGDEGLVNVFGHAFGVTADVEIGAVLKPGPKVFRVFQHSILDVNFVRLIAGKSE